MGQIEEKRLLEEYKANVLLWIHDDTLRQKRTGNFLTINTILIVALTALLSIIPHISNLAIAAILISIFGLLISFIWYSILQRNSHYVRFRRYQLRYLESKMPPMTTFTNTYDAFYEHKSLEYKEIGETFSIVKGGRKSSTVTEGHLPIIVVVFWALVFLIGIFHIDYSSLREFFF